MRPPALTARRSGAAVAVLLLAGVGAACGGDQSDEAATVAVPAAPGFPVTVTNCGTDVTFDAAPERVLMLARPDIFGILLELGVADRVVARAGAFPDEYFDDEGAAAVAATESLGEDMDESGHLQISQEAILAVEPDLVVGVPDGIDRAALQEQGIAVLDQTANCPEGISDIGYDDVYAQVDLYGDVFGRQEEAAALVASLQERVAAVEAAAAAQDRTVAILYPTVGGGTVYAYGSQSMSGVIAESAGLTNVFADSEERVFEVTTEELIARDPDTLILLHVDGEADPVTEAVRSLPGADGITAVREDAVLTMLFQFGEYPTPLVVDGLERVAETFAQG